MKPISLILFSIILLLISCEDQIQEPDPIVIDCFPDAAAYCRIRTASDVEIAMEETAFGTMPKIFKTGESIDAKESWLTIEPLMNFSIASFSDQWDVNNYSNYLGFRTIISSDTTFGWIRLNTHYTTRIDIYDYAIEK